MPGARPRLRLVMGFKKDVPPQSPLEQRAFADLAFTSCGCSLEGTLEAHSCDPCFGRWLRARLMEHWRADRYWRELDRNDFGLLTRAFHPNESLVADIVVLIMTGNENLTILTWALETRRPLDQVVEILTVLDINARRLPRFSWMLGAAEPRRSLTR